MGTAILMAFLGALAVAVTLDKPAAYAFGGQPVHDADELVGEAERAFLRAVGREDASLGDGAGCFFSQLRSGADIEPALRCGPVVHFGGEADRPWDHLALRTRNRAGGADGVTLETTGEVDPGRTLADGELLSRPDGRRPPAATAVATLPSPGPPRMAPGGLVVARVPGDLARRAVGTAISPVGELEVTLVELATATEVEVDDGPRRAARGEELLVAVLDIRGGDGASIEVVTGRRRTLPSEPLGSGRHTLVMSTPVGMDSRLEVTFRGISQSLSLRTGQRAGDRPVLLDERPMVTIGLVVERQEVASGLDGPAATVALSRFTVAEASLLAHSRLLGAAPRGQGWLAVVLDGFGPPSVSGASAVGLDVAASFVVQLPDGRQVMATEFVRTDEGPTAYFVVPDATRAAVVRITPTFAVAGTTGPGRVAFATTEVALDLR